MSGGNYIIFSEEPVTVDHLRPVLRSLADRWPEAVTEDGGGRATWPLANLSDVVMPELMGECFVYRTRALQSRLDEVGVTPDLEDEFVYIITDDDGMTVVVGNGMLAWAEQERTAHHGRL